MMNSPGRWKATFSVVVRYPLELFVEAFTDIDAEDRAWEAFKAMTSDTIITKCESEEAKLAYEELEWLEEVQP